MSTLDERSAQDYESAKQAIDVVLDKLRSLRDPDALFVTLGHFDLEILIQGLTILQTLMREEVHLHAGPPF